MRIEADGGDIEVRLAGLSEPQLKVVLLLSHGHSNKTIAYVLNRPGATVKAHVSAIMRALGCTTAPKPRS